MCQSTNIIGVTVWIQDVWISKGDNISRCFSLLVSRHAPLVVRCGHPQYACPRCLFERLGDSTRESHQHKAVSAPKLLDSWNLRLMA